MVRQVHKPEGPLEDFKKLFAFREMELSRAFELTGRIFPGFTKDEFADSQDRVHTLLFEGTEEHPIEMGGVKDAFGITTAGGFASSILLAAAVPRWKMEGLLAERPGGQLETLMVATRDGQGDVVPLTGFKASGSVIYPLRKK